MSVPSSNRTHTSRRSPNDASQRPPTYSHPSQKTAKHHVESLRLHFLRNVFSVIPKGSGEMVAATIRTIFIQPTAEAVHHQLDAVADMLGQQFPKVRQMLLDAKEELTAFAAFPISHWKKVQSSNPLERINREIKRRTDVVQVFPNPAALERLVTAVLSGMHDEWIAFPRRYLSQGSMTAIYAAEHTDHTPHALPNTPNATDD
ncbi:transposase [Streptomyces sp. NPDC058086]|uniref:transposase n=1 Tax=Streptomyces sp. NPDC058086 TaxID=3346334 RepID=UPI0036E7E8A1